MVVNWDGEKEYDYVKLSETWDNIYREYADLKDDNRTLYYFKLITRISYLKMRIYFCTQLALSLYSKDFIDHEIFLEYKKSLALWGIPYNGNELNDKDLERLMKDIQFTKNEIGLKKSELKSLKDGGGEPMPLMKQVVQAEQALGKNVIDPETTSVEKWVYYMDAIRDIAQQRKKMENGKQV